MAGSKEKKRKRVEDGAPRPKKKVAIQEDTSSQPSQSGTIKVASIQTSKQCPPIIGTEYLFLFFVRVKKCQSPR